MENTSNLFTTLIFIACYVLWPFMYAIKAEVVLWFKQRSRENTFFVSDPGHKHTYGGSVGFNGNPHDTVLSSFHRGNNAILEELGWQKLQTRRKAVKEKQFSKLVNKTAPKYLYELLPGTVGENSQRNLRNANDIKSIKCRTETFKCSFIPSSISHWNERKNNDIQEIKKACNNLFYFGRRETQIKHAQLRMKCSKLNAHLFNLHVTESPDCHCGFNCEDTSHYLLQCPLYINERNELIECLRNLRCYTVNEDILLRGFDTFEYETNLSIFAAVFLFIEKTKRL